MVVLLLAVACSGDDGESGRAASSTTAAATTTEPPDPGYEPVYDDADCPDGVPDDPRVTCGVLTVPEDRADPDGDQVRLPVVTIAAKESPARADPILYLEGGPGFGGAGAAGFLLDLDLGGERDVVTFDQRGTGHAEPSLNCPESDAAAVATTSTGDPPDAEEAVARRALLECRERLVDSGVDLATYNTATSAADVADLMAAMGHDEWNLFGVSYGTQLGLEVMRNHPRGIRAAVLDSVIPPHLVAALDPASFVERLDRVIELLATRCAADPECRAAYPDPKGDFDALLAKYEAEPFRGEVTDPLTGDPMPVVVNGQDIVGGAFQAFYDSALIPLLPQITTQLLAGDTGVIPPLVQQALGQAVAEAEAMNVSVNCSDEAALLDDDQAEEIEALVEERPLYEQFIGAGASICEVWDVPPAPAGYNDPVTSDIRTLVLAGEFDPVTPPEWSRSAADHLEDAAYVEFPGLGHGEVFAHECPRSIFRAFIDDPDAAVDTSCVNQMGPPDFAVP